MVQPQLIGPQSHDNLSPHLRPLQWFPDSDFLSEADCSVPPAHSGTSSGMSTPCTSSGTSSSTWGTTLSPGSPVTTSTILTIRTSTITACPSTVTDCPASQQTTYVTTETVVVRTTICPVTAEKTAPTVTVSVVATSGSKPGASTSNTTQETTATVPVVSGTAGQTAEQIRSKSGSSVTTSAPSSPVYTGAASWVSVVPDTFYAAAIVAAILI